MYQNPIESNGKTTHEHIPHFLLKNKWKMRNCVRLNPPTRRLNYLIQVHDMNFWKIWRAARKGSFINDVLFFQFCIFWSQIYMIHPFRRNIYVWLQKFIVFELLVILICLQYWKHKTPCHLWMISNMNLLTDRRKKAKSQITWPAKWLLSNHTFEVFLVNVQSKWRYVLSICWRKTLFFSQTNYVILEFRASLYLIVQFSNFHRSVMLCSLSHTSPIDMTKR